MVAVRMLTKGYMSILFNFLYIFFLYVDWVNVCCEL